jgi:hypothetical protein
VIFEMRQHSHCGLITIRRPQGSKWAQCGDCPSVYSTGGMNTFFAF